MIAGYEFDNLRRLIAVAQKDIRELHRETRILLTAIILQYGNKDGELRVYDKFMGLAYKYEIEQRKDEENWCMLYRIKEM